MSVRSQSSPAIMLGSAIPYDDVAHGDWVNVGKAESHIYRRVVWVSTRALGHHDHTP